MCVCVCVCVCVCSVFKLMVCWEIFLSVYSWSIFTVKSFQVFLFNTILILYI